MKKNKYIWVLFFLIVMISCTKKANLINPGDCPITVHKDDAIIVDQKLLPNGYFVYSRLESPGLYISSVKNFKPTLVPNTSEDQIRNISISNDGMWICYIDISRYRICLIKRTGCNKTIVPLENVDYGYPMVAGFHRLSSGDNAIFYLSNQLTLRSVLLNLDSTPQFSNDKIVAILGPTYKFNPNGNVNISVVNNQIFTGVIRVVEGKICYSTVYLTIPSNGIGTANDLTINKWKDDSTFATYGCGHTQSHDGLYCLANIGSPVGNPKCIANHHNGFGVTSFRYYTDTAIYFQTELADKYACSINWCPIEYQDFSQDKSDFGGWYLSNNNQYVIGRQMGSLNQDCMWINHWPTNAWYRISPVEENISTQQPAVYFYKDNDDTLDVKAFCNEDSNTIPIDTGIDPFNPHYRIVSPNGGEKLLVGSTAVIKLSATIVSNAYLYISPNAGKYWYTIAGLPTIVVPYSDSVINFIVPDSLDDGIKKVSSISNNCLLKVRDYSNGKYYDISDAVFSISYDSTSYLPYQSFSKWYFTYSNWSYNHSNSSGENGYFNWEVSKSDATTTINIKETKVIFKKYFSDQLMPSHWVDSTVNVSYDSLYIDMSVNVIYNKKIIYCDFLKNLAPTMPFKYTTFSDCSIRDTFAMFEGKKVKGVVVNNQIRSLILLENIGPYFMRYYDHYSSITLTLDSIK